MKKAFSVLTLAILTGCGGGGGGGGGGSTTVSSPFISWNSIRPSSSVAVTGDSYQGTYSVNSTTELVTGFTTGNLRSNASLTQTFDGNGAVTQATLQSGEGTVLTFSLANGDVFAPLDNVYPYGTDFAAAVSRDQNNVVIAKNPFTASSFNYQTFGLWTTGLNSTGGTYGFFTVGNQTLPTQLLTTGTANYWGRSTGLFIDATGRSFFTASVSSSSVNFGTRSISFETRNTGLTEDLNRYFFDSNLDLSGTLTITSGSGSFSGSVTSRSQLNGTATGKFYGPSAQELGGTFAVQGNGAFYGGAFGQRNLSVP